jgi:ribosomal protein L29
MAKEEKQTQKEDKKMKDLKIELLKQTSKRRNVRKEIARILTSQQNTENKSK